jgi:hypothetical protein
MNPTTATQHGSALAPQTPPSSCSFCLISLASRPLTHSDRVPVEACFITTPTYVFPATMAIYMRLSSTDLALWVVAVVVVVQDWTMKLNTSIPVEVEGEGHVVYTAISGKQTVP